MNDRTQRNYPYSINESTLQRGKQTQKPPRKILRKLLVLILFAVGIYYLINWFSLDALVARLPFPKKLEVVIFLHNGKEVILLPDSQGIINPRDSLQLVEVQTDGWVSWGTRVRAADVELEPMMEGPVVIRDLIPDESFETPRLLDIHVLLWNRPIGKVSFLVQLDSRDWVQKAGMVEDQGKRLTYLENALRENPTNTLIKTQLAALYFDAEKYEKALTLYREVNEAGQSATILTRLIEIYTLQKKINEALAVYPGLVKMTEDPAHFKSMLDYLGKHQSKADALAFLEKHQNNLPKTFQSSLYLHLADLSSQIKNWSKAAGYYDLAIKAGIKDSNVIYNLAVSYQQAGDVNKAFSAMDQYVKARPNDTKSLMQLAGLAEKKGDRTRARQIYEGILKGDPQNKEALVRLIALLEKSGDKAALESAYEQLARQQPDNKTVLHNLAIMQYNAGKLDKALIYFEKIAKADSRDVKVRTYLLDIYRKQKNEKGELETLKALAALEPADSSHKEAIFAFYDEKKDYKSIRTYFQPVSAQNPNSVSIRNYLLYAALKLGDKSAAVKELEALARLQPKEKKHLKQAADLYESMGKFADASKKYEQIIALDPKDKSAQDAYLKLQMKIIREKKS